MPINKQKEQLMNDWLHTRIGKILKKIEAELIFELDFLLCNNCCLLGPNEYLELVPKESKKTFYLSENRCIQSNVITITAKAEYLPLANDSMQLVMIMHSLEFVNNPHQVLREAYRILAPGGQLLVACFNPYSLMGALKPGVRLINGTPWDGNFISTIKLKDWLALLGFDIMRISSYGFCLPLVIGDSGHPHVIEKFMRFVAAPFGSANLLRAKKSMQTLTPIYTPWNEQEPVLTIDNLEITPSTEKF